MKILRNQQGAALITAMVILVLLTIIGIAATNTSMLETMISGTERSRSEAFNVAEAGVEHLRIQFNEGIVDNFNPSATEGIWNFALDGSAGITGGNLGGHYLYDVTVWNNQDDGSATNDTDGIIFLRADARDPRTDTIIASIETLLEGKPNADAISNYGAQEGGGSGKNYSANDVNAITTFDKNVLTKRK